MKFIKFSLLSLFIMTSSGFAQEEVSEEVVKGHTNENKFKQLKDEYATPNAYHLASGAPGPMYTQQQVDYKMDIVLNDKARNIEILMEGVQGAAMQSFANQLSEVDMASVITYTRQAWGNADNGDGEIVVPKDIVEYKKPKV